MAFGYRVYRKNLLESLCVTSQNYRMSTHVEKLRSAIKAIPDAEISALSKASGVPAIVLRRFRDGQLEDITYTYTMALRKAIRKNQVMA